VIAAVREQQERVFSGGFEVLYSEVANRNPLAGRKRWMPFEPAALKVLYDQAIVDFKVRDRVAELGHTAVLIEKFQERITNFKAGFWE
jgi:hypothetical protein